MKHLLVALLPLIALAACSTAPEDNFATLSKNFASPPNEYRPAPLWVWTGTVTRERIDWSMKEFENQGFGGLFIHPRPGLITEYLSDEWFDLVAYSVQKAGELGMDIWIYDENSYPSGFAGGFLPEAMPESYNEGVGLVPSRAGILPEDVSKYSVVVLKNGDTMTDITYDIDLYGGVEGDYYLYEKSYYPESPWYADHSYTDLLKEGVSEKFFDITMSGYENSVGAQFGGIVKGIFTDEPEIPAPNGSIRWTPDLFPFFKHTYGYSLSDNLPSLYLPYGDYKKVRHDYTQMLSRLFIDRWAKTGYDYCDNHNLIWTGHYWEHSWPKTHGVPDNMAMYAWHQMPGIDMLFNTFNEEDPYAQFGNIRSVKEVVSVANQLGRPRVLSETYGGAGWNLTFKEMKRYADWQFVLGINFMNQHISPLTIEGVRKHDYPPMFSPAAPWWEDYGEMNAYNTRMSYALSRGEQQNDVLVLSPTTSLWLTNKTFGDYIEDEAFQTGNEFQKLVTAMTKAMVEYDIGCEEIIKTNGMVEDGKFYVGRREYSKVVIPPLTENIEAETFTLLREFADSGGEIFVFDVPTRVSGSISNNISEFFGDKKNVTMLKDMSKKRLKKNFINKETVDFQSNKGGNLYHMRRVMTDGQLFMLANVSTEERNKTTFTAPGTSVTLFDAATGEMFEYPAYVEAGRATVTVNLHPAESILLFVGTQKNALPKYKPMPDLLHRVSAPTSAARTRDNVLAVDFVDLKLGAQTFNDIYFYEANNEYYRQAGWGDRQNPWFQGIQFRGSIVNRKPDNDRGFTVDYRFNVDGSVKDFSSFRAVVEKGDKYTVRINGEEVRPGEGFLFDTSQNIIDISKYVKAGVNDLELTLAKYDPMVEIQMAYITGDFDVEAKNGEWVITAPKAHNDPGLWRDQGAPFYPWSVAYTKTIKPTAEKRYVVMAPSWKGTAAEVYVNGEKAGLIYTDPYTLEITGKLKAGEKNSVELRVIGSLDNFIGPHHRPRRGITSPWSWWGVTKRTPAEGYVFTDYGLMEDYSIYEI